jgi:predicted nucleic acid-binding protein
MIILDSNIWIAYLNKEDAQHKKAVSLFEEIDDGVIISEYILLEVITVLAMKVNKKVADSFINFVFNNQDIKILPSSGELFSNFLKGFLKHKKNNLSFVDISLLVLSKKYSVFSFDKELEKEIKKIN